ncbi:MAG: DUF3899 domain-containing protein [Bacilli bacterium]
MSTFNVRRLLTWLSAFLIGGSIFCLVFFLRSDWTFRGASDGCFVSAAVLLSGVALMGVTRLGTFDILAYSFYRLFESFRAGNVKKFDTFYDYRNAKIESRHHSHPAYWPFLIIGILGFVLALVFTFLFNQQIR